MCETSEEKAAVPKKIRIGCTCAARNNREEDSALTAKRILYVNYNPATLIRDEQSLMRAGCEVDSVFGTDGLMACESVAEYTSVLLDDACRPEDREKVITWLTANFPKLNVLPAGNLSKRRDLRA
jgi:hypothetical protein